MEKTTCLNWILGRCSVCPKNLSLEDQYSLRGVLKRTSRRSNDPSYLKIPDEYPNEFSCIDYEKTTIHKIE
jgi:hypothetical protein